jgi:hypothetical protein
VLNPSRTYANEMTLRRQSIHTSRRTTVSTSGQLPRGDCNYQVSPFDDDDRRDGTRGGGRASRRPARSAGMTDGGPAGAAGALHRR